MFIKKMYIVLTVGIVNNCPYALAQEEHWLEVLVDNQCLRRV